LTAELPDAKNDRHGFRQAIRAIDLSLRLRLLNALWNQFIQK
jgi:hypothetical protein